LNLRIQPQNLATIALVLLDQRKIPNRHRANPGQDEQKDDDTRQLAPDSEIDFHYAELSRRRRFHKN